jgi:hypothetical protein
LRTSKNRITIERIQTVKDIASDFIEAQKEVVGSFQSQIDKKSGTFYAFWDLYNPQRIAEIKYEKEKALL